MARDGAWADRGVAQLAVGSFSMRLRVLVVVPLGEALGGGEQMLRQLLRSSDPDAVEWHVVFLRNGPLVAEMRAHANVHVVDAGRFRNLGRRAAAVRRVAAIARACRAELVFGWMVAGQATAGPAALLAGVPNAWYQVGTPRPDWLDRFATLWPARGVIALSRDGVKAQSRIWPQRPVRLVYPGVSLDVIEGVRAQPPEAMRRRLGLPTDSPVVGLVGRLQRWKGIHVFLDAIVAARRAVPNLRGVVVGGPHETEPEYPEELRAQAERLGIGDAVRFTGFQPNPVEWMQAMDVVVHASDHEPFGIVVVEAMALGKPVVAGAGGGPSEIIATDKEGVLIPFGDAAGIAASVVRLLGDAAAARAMGEAARIRAADFAEPAYAAEVVAAMRAFAREA